MNNFDSKVPHAITTLESESEKLYFRIMDIDRKLDGDPCECDCVACEECEGKDLPARFDIIRLEEERELITEKHKDIETTLRRLKGWAKVKNIELETKK